MQKYFGLAQDAYGNRIPSATVNVYLAGTLNAATIFSDNSYSAKANPFTSDSDGTYEFYARNGRYDVVVTKSPFVFTGANSSDASLLDVSTAITPSQIITSQNDYNPTNGLNAAVWRIDSDDNDNELTGIAAGYAQQYITLVNVGSRTLKLAHESSSSSAANRILCPAEETFILHTDSAVTLVYDNTQTRWVVLSPRRGRIVDYNDTAATTSNSNAITSLYAYTVPIQTFNEGDVLRMHASGTLANTTGGTVNYTFRVGIGAAFNLPAITVPNAVTLNWNFEVIQTFVSSGTTIVEAKAICAGPTPTMTTTLTSIEHNVRAHNPNAATTNELFLQMGTASVNASFTFTRAFVDIRA